MSGFWQITNRGAAGVAATASQTSPGAAAAAGQLLRLRALQVTISGTGAGSDEVVVRDGATGVGAIIWSADLSIGANGTAQIALTNLDLRASVGNALTVEFVNGLASDRENINAQGDYISIGWPFGQA